jgi:hypothetical protein
MSILELGSTSESMLESTFESTPRPTLTSPIKKNWEGEGKGELQCTSVKKEVGK